MKQTHILDTFVETNMEIGPIDLHYKTSHLEATATVTPCPGGYRLRIKQDCNPGEYDDAYNYFRHAVVRVWAKMEGCTHELYLDATGAHLFGTLDGWTHAEHYGHAMPINSTMLHFAATYTPDEYEEL